MKKVVEKQVKDEKVNVYNDEEMVSLGIRNPKVSPRDPNVWTKTLEEKAKARVARNTIKACFSSNISKNKYVPFYGDLIVYIKPSSKYYTVDAKSGKKFNKTTFSHKCNQSDIPFILSKYFELDPRINLRISLVVKYSWNGKTYSPRELPFCN